MVLHDMKKRKQFFGLRYPDAKPIFFDRLGTEFQTSGLILKGMGGATICVYLPDEEYPRDNSLISHLELSADEWVSVLKQLDDPEIFIQDASGATKAIVRKNQRLLGATLQWEIYRRDNYTCQYCGRNDVSMTIDHYLPVELGGTDEKDNLKTACRKCNKRKGNLHPRDWEKVLKEKK